MNHFDPKHLVIGVFESEIIESVRDPANGSRTNGFEQSENQFSYAKRILWITLTNTPPILSKIEDILVPHTKSICFNI